MTDFEQAKLYFKNATPTTKEVEHFYDVAYHALLFAEDFIGIDLDKMKKSMNLYDVFESFFTDENKKNLEIGKVEEELKKYFN